MRARSSSTSSTARSRSSTARTLHVLRVGDSIYLDSIVPHQAAARGPCPPASLRSCTRRSRGDDRYEMPHTELTIGRTSKSRCAHRGTPTSSSIPTATCAGRTRQFDERRTVSRQGVARDWDGARGDHSGNLGAQRAGLADVHVRDRQDRRRARHRQPGLQERTNSRTSSSSPT